ncbi:CPBP family intramembrane glutamic endopeptidase [Kiritimatiella glycovorans]|nr:CPBP family intramembrane glutamic endopeptidase [Kiritimatiella glycovorans]
MRKTNLAGSLILLLAGAPLVGAWAAPHVYAFLQRWAPEGTVWDADFDRVVSRCIMGFALLLLVPCTRMAGFRRPADFGLAANRERARRNVATGAAAGAVSMMALYGLGLAAGAFVIASSALSPAGWVVHAAEIAAGAMLVGILEEFLFRGYLYGALRSMVGMRAAVISAALIFAAVHFIRPGEDASGGWGVLSTLFGGVEDTFAAEFTTLLLMGALLSLLYELTGSLYAGIGLHAGWVCAMRVSKTLLDHGSGDGGFWFGPSEWLSKDAAGVAAAALFLAALLGFRLWAAAPLRQRVRARVPAGIYSEDLSDPGTGEGENDL